VVVNKENIENWLANGSMLGADHLDALKAFTKEYPYYGPTQVLLAKVYFNIGNVGFDQQLRKAALTTSDRVWLYDFIHSSSVEQVEETQLKEVQVEEKEPKVKVAQSVVEPKSNPKKVKKVKTKKEESKAVKAADKKVSKKTKKEKTAVVKKAKVKKAKSPVAKIKISLGEGEVTKEVLKPEEPIEAKAPKLVMDDNPKEENVVDTKGAVPRIEELKEDMVPANNSFLDWLNYTDLNEEEQNEVSIVKPAESVYNLETAFRNLPDSDQENNVEKTANLLEKFIANKPKPGEIKLENYDPEEKSMLSDSAELIPVSETLAQVYISQNEVEMAQEVYEKLILKFPEKSTYFADLIQKLNRE